MKDLKILIPLGLFIISEAVAGIWWASATDTEVTQIKKSVDQIEENQLNINTIQTEQKHQTEQLKENKELLQEILRQLRTQ